MAPPDGVELVRSPPRRGRFRAAVFDFDGTVSLIREGWSGIMAGLGLELLREQNLADDPDGPHLVALEDAMLRLSGKPSIFQMRRLAGIIAEKGGTPGDPDAYLREFLTRVLALADGRKADLRSGAVPPAAWTVRGSHEVLDELRRRGIVLYLASGTDLAFVREEAGMLGLTEFFDDRIYAPADNTPNFGKKDVIAMVLREHGIGGDQLLGFGDGYSETVEVRAVDGFMVGVASREPDLPGVHELKRAMLSEIGADVIVADYAEPRRLVEWLFEA